MDDLFSISYIFFSVAYMKIVYIKLCKHILFIFLGVGKDFGCIGAALEIKEFYYEEESHWLCMLR